MNQALQYLISLNRIDRLSSRVPCMNEHPEVMLALFPKPGVNRHRSWLKRLRMRLGF